MASSSSTRSPSLDKPFGLDEAEKSQIAVHQEQAISEELSPEHREFLLSRHGTVDLDPIPSMDLNDPLNWPRWKKNATVFLVAFHCMSSTLMAAGIVPAYESMAEQYNKPLPAVSYLTSTQILIFGVLPSLWVPLMNYYGRRPFLTISVLGAMACNIGGGFCKTYGQQMATRALLAFFVCPSIAVGSVIVTEMCFAHERGVKNGVWALMLTVGTPSGPFLMGFVEKYAATRWIYWTFAIMNFCTVIAWLFADETLYDRTGQINSSQIKSRFRLRPLVPGKINWWEIVTPLKRGLDYRVLIVSCSYAIVFCYANIALVVEMPQVYGSKFNLDAEGIGLQFIAIIIGSVLGEILAGPLSDYWMKICIKRRNGVKVIEDRLTVSYTGFIFVIFGLIIFGVRVQQAKQDHWNITPLIGAAFASAGNQIVTTPLITYAVDANYFQSFHTSLFISLIRQVWGFLGPLYFPPMFDNLGFGGAYGLMAGLVGVCAFLPVVILQFVNTRRFKNAA